MGCRAFWHLRRRRRFQLLCAAFLLVTSTWGFRVSAEGVRLSPFHLYRPCSCPLLTHHLPVPLVRSALCGQPVLAELLPASSSLNAETRCCYELDGSEAVFVCPLVPIVTEKPPAISVESFVSSLDRDGDGEICTEEANKVRRSLDGARSQLD